MGNRLLKILFFGESITAAHATRPIALAACLPKDQFECHIATDPSYFEHIKAEGIITHELHSIKTMQFQKAIESGTSIYTKSDLDDYLEEDLKLIDSIQPDLVVGDFRLTLSVSCRLREVPYIAICNSYWSPFAKVKFRLGDSALASLIGYPLAQTLFKLVRPIVFRTLVKPMNRIRKTHGLAPLKGDIREMYTEADWTLYADLPEFLSLKSLPINHEFVGPVVWQPEIPLPDWWNEAIATSRQIVYIALGSTGDTSMLPKIIEALDSLDVTLIIAAKKNMTDSITSKNQVFAAPLLPGRKVMEHASLVISNGGVGTSLQAIEAGVQSLGICTNMDQLLCSDMLEKHELGKGFHRYGLTSKQIRTEAERMLRLKDNPSTTTKLFTKAFKDFETSSRFQEILRKAVVNKK